MELVLNIPVLLNSNVTKEEQHPDFFVIEAAKKNPKYFAPLYEKYYEYIFRFIYQRVDDKELALDITSQVFLKAMSHLSKYKHKGFPFSSWLYRIARNEVYTSFKNKKAKRTINIDSVNIYNLIDEIETDRLEQYYDQLIKTIADLPEDELQLIEMRFFEKRSFKEIGEILEITENNAKVRLYRVLDKLKNMIKTN